MSIYIQDMKIPTAGRILIIFPSGRTLEVSADSTQNIFGEAQAVPVPPHGRLIDADALELDAQKRMLLCAKNNNQFQKPYEVMRAIALAPTIIPAWEGE